MSHDAMTWAKRQTVGGPARKAVLMNLADRADEAWSCYPGQVTIARETEQSERSVRGHLAALRDQGLITSERRHRRDGSRTSSRYYLTGLPAGSAAGETAHQPTSRTRRLPAEPAGPTGRTTHDLPAEPAGQEEPPEEPPGEPPVTPTAPPRSPRRAAPAAPAEPDEHRVELKDLRATPEQRAALAAAPVDPVQEQLPGTALARRADPNSGRALQERAEATFDDWWDAYPHKVGKKAAKAAYTRALRETDAQTLAAAVAAAAAGPWRGKDLRFVPHPVTWLNQGRWDDVHDPGAGMHPVDAAAARNLAVLAQLRAEEHQHQQPPALPTDPWSIR